MQNDVIFADSIQNMPNPGTNRQDPSNSRSLYQALTSFNVGYNIQNVPKDIKQGTFNSVRSANDFIAS